MKQVTLRALEPEDIDLIYRWENDPEVWEQSLAHQHFSRHALTQYIIEASQSDIYSARQLRLMAMDAEGGETVGCIDLAAFDPYHRRAEIGILVDRRQQGKGYGKVMVKALVNYAGRYLRLHQLHCDIASDNLASLAVFEACGFEQQGLRKDWIWTPSGWKDAILFSKILDV